MNLEVDDLYVSSINVLDVINKTMIKNASLTIENGIIKKIETEPAKGQKALDVEGLWALPSFIDLHGHIMFEGRSHWLTSYAENEDETHALCRGVSNAKEALLAGICVIRDVGCNFHYSKRLQELVESGKFLGPKLVLCGQPITALNGHCESFCKVIEPGLSEGEIEKLVVDHATHGYEWLKIMNSPPALFTKGDFQKLVNIAKTHGLKIASHVFTKEAISECLVCGVDTIEHGLGYDASSIELSKEKHICFVPTYFSSIISLDKAYLKNISIDAAAYLLEWRSFLLKNIEQNIKADVMIATGTDGGFAPSNFSHISSEIQCLVDSGMSAIDAIRSASITPAKILALDDRWGSISEGKYANMLIYDHNPLMDLRSLANPQEILFQGMRLKGGLLSAEWAHSHTLGNHEGVQSEVHSLLPEI